jgi:gliding motility-associated lipoprotein GldH
MTRNQEIQKSSWLQGLLFCAFFIIVSCGETGTQMDFQKLPKEGWPLRAPVRFSIEVQDTISPQSVFITLRHTNDYPFSNIFLITTFAHPNGTVITDTLSYDLAAADGQWLGSGNGLITHTFPYKKKVVFNTSKAYILSVYQSVRQLGSEVGIPLLSGVTEVGYQIEK